MFSAASVCLSVCVCVCQCVCPHDNSRTTKRRTIKLRGLVHCTKISSEFEGQDQRSKVKVTRDKKERKAAESSPLTMHSRACAVARPHAARSNRRYHCVPPEGDGLRRWENQRMLSSYQHEIVGTRKERRQNENSISGISDNDLMCQCPKLLYSLFISTANVVQQCVNDSVEGRDLLLRELLLFTGPPQGRHVVVEDDGLVQHDIDFLETQNVLLQVPDMTESSINLS